MALKNAERRDDGGHAQGQRLKKMRIALRSRDGSVLRRRIRRPYVLARAKW